nr:glycosyltransferase family 4 protein [Desulfopila inferna]
MPLFDDAYLRNLYAGKKSSHRAIFKYYHERAQALCKLKKVDLIILEKEALPYIPFWIENFLMPSCIPYVVDYDDAIFHNYDLSKRFMVRQLLGRKIDRVMAKAAMVVCGNTYLGNRAKKAGARRIEIVPTVVDTSRYSPGRMRDRQVPVIGWIGSPTTQEYIRDIGSVLQRVCSEVGGRLVLVGVQQKFLEELNIIHAEIIQWQEATEAEVVAGFDIGIMPLPDGPWERGKCGYKLIQYMACGLPVVASPVGVNSKIIQHGENGFLASTLQEWEWALIQLLFDSKLRRSMGRKGRAMVEEEYALQVQAQRWVQILKAVAG